MLGHQNYFGKLLLIVKKRKEKKKALYNKSLLAISEERNVNILKQWNCLDKLKQSKRDPLNLGGCIIVARCVGVPNPSWNYAMNMIFFFWEKE